MEEFDYGVVAEMTTDLMPMSKDCSFGMNQSNHMHISSS
jgi:hypothetical protein